MSKCYVFSQATLDLAFEEWLKSATENNKIEEEAAQITVVALPWFLKHLNQTKATIVFSHELLLTEMETWKDLQVANYPKQKKRITSTCRHLLNFFESDVMLQHKMIIETT